MRSSDISRVVSQGSLRIFVQGLDCRFVVQIDLLCKSLELLILSTQHESEHQDACHSEGLKRQEDAPGDLESGLVLIKPEVVGKQRGQVGQSVRYTDGGSPLYWRTRNCGRQPRVCRRVYSKRANTNQEGESISGPIQVWQGHQKYRTNHCNGTRYTGRDRTSLAFVGNPSNA
jgi:hypothetical protein